MTSPEGPIRSGERIATLDAIRGIALLGIFIMNMPAFNTSQFARFAGPPLWPDWWDRTAETVRDVLFAGKFNSMFSMLFAIGFTIQLGRLLEREPQRAVWIYTRRIIWLLVFGVIHTCVFWNGDVLHMYALLGLLLLVLQRLPDRALIGLVVACLLYPTAYGLVRMIIVTPEDIQRLGALMKSLVVAADAAYGRGTFLQAAYENTRVMILLYTYPPLMPIPAAGYVQYLTTMLLGLLLGRHRFFQNAIHHLPLVRRVQWGALGVGVGTGIVYGVWTATVKNPLDPTPWRMIASTSFVLCRLAVMIFYVSLIIRAMHSDRWRRRLEPVTLAGRMPLTNYLAQTLLGTFIFFGWGLGFWGRVGPAVDLVLAVVIFFGIQVPLSRLWLRHFELGPMEYLWRVLTYGRPALRSIVRRTPAARADT